MPSDGEDQPRRRSRASIDDLKRPWREFLRERGLHESRTREAVVDAFFEATDHVDQETLLERARRRSPGIGLATIYRTLKLLQEAGLAHAQQFGGKITRYEVVAGEEHHDHLVCQSCGLIVEYVSEEIERLQEGVAEKHGFKLVGHRHELYGVCPKCRKKAGRR